MNKKAEKLEAYLKEKDIAYKAEERYDEAEETLFFLPVEGDRFIIIELDKYDIVVGRVVLAGDVKPSYKLLLKLNELCEYYKTHTYHLTHEGDVTAAFMMVATDNSFVPQTLLALALNIDNAAQKDIPDIMKAAYSED